MDSMTAPTATASPEVDLSACDQEPIHIPGSIQPHGLLFVLQDPGLTIVQVSANVQALLGLPPQQVLGKPIEGLLNVSRREALRAWLADAHINRANPLQVSLGLASGVLVFDAVVHRAEQGLILELDNPRSARAAEDAQSNILDPYFQLVQRTLLQLRGCATAEALCAVLVQELQAFTSFDRVLVYRFAADGHGEVIAESVVEGCESYLGLHYPASDIPQQARILYRLNVLRAIVDAGYEPVSLVPLLHPGTGQPLDLSFALLRSVAPVHLQYLKNMGVAATLTISLLRGAELWGLIACHHRTPKFVPYNVRAACVMLSTVMSAQLVLKEQSVLEQQRTQLRHIHAELLHRIASEDDVLASLTAHADRLIELVRAEGLAILLNRRLRLLGRTPERSQVAEILVFLNKQGAEFFHCHNLPEQLPSAALYRSTASGLLALNFGRGNYLLFFRPEVVHTLHWAGNPNEPTLPSGEGGMQLQPRRSFAAWLQTIRLRALPWSETELEIAREFHSALTVFILRRSEELERLNRELLAKNQEMEQFVYTVSHDLKSPLVTCMGYIGMMEEDLSTGNLDEVRDSARRIRGAAERMSHLIDDLLELSRVGRHGHHPRLLDTRVLAAELVAEWAERFALQRVQVRIQSDLPAVYADETSLNRLLENLLENALKYGCVGPEPVIHIGGEATEEEVRLFVRDNGPGIAEEYHQKIFRLFQRLDASKKGTGVGLASVAKIMSMHKGRAWVESSMGQGATFWLAFPQDS